MKMQMRKIFSLIPMAALAATALFAQAPAPKPPSVTPRPAGEFVLNMADGSKKLLSSYRGKEVVMAFMYTTCPHCQHTSGILQKIQAEYAGKGVQILGVVIDPGAKEGIPGFLKITGATFPIGYSTPELAMKFLHGPADGWYVPMLAFIDATGTVRSQYIVLDPGDAPSKWLEDQDADPKKGDRGNIRKEIDKYLKAAAPAKPAAPAKVAN